MTDKIGVPCAGGCGKYVIPVQANDCGTQEGPWYCEICYQIEAKKRNERT